MENSAK